jgi:hypothetical protein
MSGVRFESGTHVGLWRTENLKCAEMSPDCPPEDTCVLRLADFKEL